MKKLIVALAIVLLLVVSFIWGNSMLSPELSSEFSESVGRIIANITGEGNEMVTAGGLSVRKLGHFAEFFALGVIANLILCLTVRSKCFRALLSVIVGISVPLLDETIQIFSGRGPSIVDVWIDIAGYATGCLVVFLAVSVYKKLSKMRQKQP